MWRECEVTVANAVTLMTQVAPSIFPATAPGDVAAAVSVATMVFDRIVRYVHQHNLGSATGMASHVAVGILELAAALLPLFPAQAPAHTTLDRLTRRTRYAQELMQSMEGLPHLPDLLQHALDSDIMRPLDDAPEKLVQLQMASVWSHVATSHSAPPQPQVAFQPHAPATYHQQQAQQQVPAAYPGLQPVAQVHYLPAPQPAQPVYQQQQQPAQPVYQQQQQPYAQQPTYAQQQPAYQPAFQPQQGAVAAPPQAAAQPRYAQQPKNRLPDGLANELKDKRHGPRRQQACIYALRHMLGMGGAQCPAARPGGGACHMHHYATVQELMPNLSPAAQHELASIRPAHVL
jgi:hypothetical protein